MPPLQPQNSALSSVSSIQTSVNGNLLNQNPPSSSIITHKKLQPASRAQPRIQIDRSKQENLNQIPYHHRVHTFEKIIFAVLFVLILGVFVEYQSDEELQLQVSIRREVDNSKPVIEEPPQVPGLCNSYLPYELSDQSELQNSYYMWYSKIGRFASVQKYDTGHFIEKHVAVNGKCTYPQAYLNETAFFDWSQVVKAFQKTSDRLCNVFDKETYRYEFEIELENPADFIKGIDCKTGTVKEFKKIEILYSKVTQKSSPQQSQYLSSKILTIWTFHPKD